MKPTFWQNENETMDAYHTRLGQLAYICEFANVDMEIKSQIILSCSSARLRLMALKDGTMALQQLLDAGRAQEMSDKQAAGIDNAQSKSQKLLSVRTVQNKKHYKSQGYESDKHQNRTCNNCGQKFPHDGRQTNCPAGGERCEECGKLNHFQKCCRSNQSPLLHLLIN